MKVTASAVLRPSWAHTEAVGRCTFIFIMASSSIDLGGALMAERATVLLADDIASIEDGTMILQVWLGH